MIGDFQFQVCRSQTARNQFARQRPGVRQPSGAFAPQSKTRKAAEGRRSPKPRGNPELRNRGARPPRALPGVPSRPAVARDTGTDAWNFFVRPMFSARARKTAPEAGALPFDFGIRGNISATFPISFFLILLICAVAADFACAAANDFFARGVEFSRAGQYPEAASAFAQSAQAQPATGTLLNLGLAEWQRGHAGAAIVAWERAQWIDPFDARAVTNLDFARQVAQVDAPELRWHETISAWLPPNAWVWLAGASLWLAVGLLVLPGVFRRRVAGWQQTLAALAFGIFLFSLTASFGAVSRTQIGFVLKKNAPLRLTPTRDAEKVATLADGEPARRLRARGNYLFIRTSATSGWIEQNEFQLICPR